MIQIRVEKNFLGPTLIEVLTYEAESHAPITVQWHNTPDERAVLDRVRQRSVTLVVEDLAAMEEAATMNGLPLAFDPATVRGGVTALNDVKVSNWRGFVRTLDPDPAASAAVARSLLIEIATRNLRAGGRGPHFRAVLYEVLFADVAPSDVDVLLGLRARR